MFFDALASVNSYNLHGRLLEKMITAFGIHDPSTTYRKAVSYQY